MADTTEKKTYLINIESNLKKYSEEAAAASKEVEKLTIENVKLKGSTTATAAEIEASNAALRNANKEYNQAKKLVDLQTAANKGEAGSRKQLGEILTLQMQALGKLGNAYVTNAKGVRELNPLYIEQRKRIGETKQAILDYDKALNDGRSNVGRYGEAIEGAFKDVGSKITSMVGPMALVGAAIGVATKLWDGMKEAIMSTTFAIDLMNKAAAISKQLFYDLAINGQLNIDSLIKASKIQGELNALRLKDAFEANEISKINREQQAIREIAIDRTKTHEERLAAFIKVRDMEAQKTKIQIGNLKDELSAKQDLLKLQPANEKLMLSIIDLNTKINDTYAAEDVAMRRVIGQITAFEQEKIDLRKEGLDKWMAEIDAQNKANEELDKKQNDTAKKREDNRKKQEIIAEQEAEKFINSELERMDKEAESKWNKEVEFQRKLFDANRAAGQSEYDARIAEAEALAEAELEIQRIANESKINLANSVANLLSATAGKNKGLQQAALIAEKALAIATVVINTTKANAAIRTMTAASVLPGPGYLGRLALAEARAQIPINLNRVAAALDIAAIIAATVVQSRSISQSGGGGSSAPTAISNSAPAQRTFAQSAGSSIFTQPQLSQPQLNAIPNQNLLTAADIANALKNLPSPVVTVEDINAKVKSVAKVAVRANI